MASCIQYGSQVVIVPRKSLLLKLKCEMSSFRSNLVQWKAETSEQLSTITFTRPPGTVPLIAIGFSVWIIGICWNSQESFLNDDEYLWIYLIRYCLTMYKIIHWFIFPVYTIYKKRVQANLALWESRPTETVERTPNVNTFTSCPSRVKSSRIQHPIIGLS